MQRPLLIAGILGTTAFICIVLLLIFSPPEIVKPPVSKNAEQTKVEYIQTHLHNLSLEDKVRQQFIWTVTGPNVSEEELKQIEALRPGGVMISGSMNHTELLRLTVQLRALKTPVPYIIAIDQEGGSVRRFSDDALGDGHVLGTTTDTQFCEDIKNSSRWLSELGVNLNFGIIADVAWTPDSYMYDRSYGSDAQNVAKHVAEAISCTTGVMTTVKHFPGHGRTTLDSHYTIPSIPLSYEEWQKTDAVPFQAAISNKVDAIMMGHLIYPDIATEPASLSPRFVAEARKMGFQGLLITDDLGMLEAAGLDPADSMRKSLAAGNDMLLYADTSADPEQLIQQAITFVKNDPNAQHHLDEHLQRILSVKYRL